MFNKVATFRMLPIRRSALGVSAPANDNRRNSPVGIVRRTRAPRLVCRWSLSPRTGRPVCCWEVDNDAPGPQARDAQPNGSPFHKTVVQLSYQGAAAGTALREPGDVSGANAPVLHARHWTMRSSSPPDPASSHRKRFALGLVANSLQLGG